MLLSILIAVYQAEEWLPRCLDSIFGQDISDVEVIVVDDGSKDRSLEIALKYKEKYPELRVFSKNNEGVAATRNVLLQYAKGE